MIPESREVHDHGSRQFDRADRRLGRAELVVLAVVLALVAVLIAA
ncbi:hypothetical protein QQG74_09755 [Micromonospora sp. FIMYZ51]